MRFVLTAFISYIIVNIGQIILKNHKKLLRYVGFVQNVLEEEDIRVKPEKVYACFNKDKDVRLSSSSGAVFSSLAEYVLNKNGIVYGVTMSEDCYGRIYCDYGSKWTNKTPWIEILASKSWGYV